MRLGLTVSAVVALFEQQPSMALVFAVLAVAWAQPTGLRSWLGWDAAMRRAEERRVDE